MATARSLICKASIIKSCKAEQLFPSSNTDASNCVVQTVFLQPEASHYNKLSAASVKLGHTVLKTLFQPSHTQQMDVLQSWPEGRHSELEFVKMQSSFFIRRHMICFISAEDTISEQDGLVSEHRDLLPDSLCKPRPSETTQRDSTLVPGAAIYSLPLSAAVCIYLDGDLGRQWRGVLLF